VDKTEAKDNGFNKALS